MEVLYHDHRYLVVRIQATLAGPKAYVDDTCQLFDDLYLTGLTGLLSCSATSDMSSTVVRLGGELNKIGQVLVRLSDRPKSDSVQMIPTICI